MNREPTPDDFTAIAPETPSARKRSGRGSARGATPRDTSAPVRAKTRVGEANVERILEAATDAFSTLGLHGARIDDIAAAAGMSKPNLLYYFRTKDLLYTAVLETTLERWLVPLGEMDDDRDPIEAITDYVARKLEASRLYPAASRLFALEILQGAPHLGAMLSGPLKALVDAKTKTIERWIAEGRLAPIDPLHLIFSIWATTQHYADFAVQIRALTGRDLADDAFYRRSHDALLAILLRGIAPR